MAEICHPKDYRYNVVVNYIPREVDEDFLAQMFGQAGEMISAKLMRDNVTGKPLGYGFIAYKTREGMYKAMTMFNTYRIFNKTLKVSHAKSSRSPNSVNLHVGNIPIGWTEDIFLEIFQPYGSIIDHRKVPNSRYGFVRFQVPKDAHSALVNLNGQFGLCVEVAKATRAKFRERLDRRKRKDSFEYFPHSHSPPHCSRWDSSEFSSPNYRRQAGFTSFDSPYCDYRRSYESLPILSPPPFDGERKVTSPESSDSSRQDFYRVRFAGLSEDLSQVSVIHSMFGNYGHVQKVNIFSSGNGIASFSFLEDAEKCVQALDQRTIFNSTLSLRLCPY